MVVWYNFTRDHLTTFFWFSVALVAALVEAILKKKTAWHTSTSTGAGMRHCPLASRQYQYLSMCLHLLEFPSVYPSKHCSGITLLNFCVPMGAEKSNMALWHCKTFKCWWRSNKLLPKYSRLVLSIKTTANRPILQKKLQKKKSLDHFWSFSGRSAFRRFPVLERIFRLEWFPAEQQLLRLSF